MIYIVQFVLRLYYLFDLKLYNGFIILQFSQYNFYTQRAYNENKLYGYTERGGNGDIQLTFI